MSNVNASIDLIDPEKIDADVRKKVMRKAAKVVSTKAKQVAPRGKRAAGLAKSGKRAGKKRRRLYQTVGYRVLQKGMVAAVVAKSPHAHLVTDGVKAHVIPVPKGGVLAIDGHVVKKEIKHPGYSGNDFLLKAAEQSRADVAAAIEGAV